MRRTTPSNGSSIALALILVACGFAVQAEPPRPNILWITSEDNGPHLGCYDDAYATTPNLDALASKSLIYLHAWSNAPVCAPARTTIITGLYPPSTGSEHMRSMTRLPAEFSLFPRYLREAGYYCTNNSKEDYNIEKNGKIWDESSPRAHWKNRAAGRPFFAVFNHTVSHESQIRKRPHTPVHDPASAPIPRYHPDRPEVRRDWAQYYDKLSEMDELAGRNLREIDDEGLADDTIVVYFGDHGSGMPRNKRCPLNSGLHVPLIVHIPEKFAHLRPKEYQRGGKSERLVSFVDLAPTMLSLAGIEPPKHLQGQAFLGPHAAPPRQYVFGFRGRMDERIDLIRSVRDQRFVYVRHYMPHLPYGQHVAYMFETPTTRVWKDLFDAGQLTGEQAQFWQAKPTEELFDLSQDVDEVRNLAASPDHREVVERMRAALRAWELEIRDVGFLPEDEIHTRSTGRSPYELGHDRDAYPLERILETAEWASARADDRTAALVARLDDPESAVRYWAAIGLLVRGPSGVGIAHRQLASRLTDESPSVRVAVADALATHGDDGERRLGLDSLLAHADLNRNSLYITVAALNAIDRLDDAGRPIAQQLAGLPRTSAKTPARMGDYADRLLTNIMTNLERK